MAVARLVTVPTFSTVPLIRILSASINEFSSQICFDEDFCKHTTGSRFLFVPLIIYSLSVEKTVSPFTTSCFHEEWTISSIFF